MAKNKKNWSGIIDNNLGLSYGGRDNITPNQSTKTDNTMVEAIKTVSESIATMPISTPLDVETVHIEEEKTPKTKKSNAGRKKMDVRKKKKQMVLTLSPEVYNRLIEWAESKPRSAPNYVSEFVEEHLKEITQ